MNSKTTTRPMIHKWKLIWRSKKTINGWTYYAYGQTRKESLSNLWGLIFWTGAGTGTGGTFA